MSQLSKTDLTGRDFSDVDLSDQSLAHSTITGCSFGKCVRTKFVCVHGANVNFNGADITNSTFENADDSVLLCLPGAKWHGQLITAATPKIIEVDKATQFGYPCFCTNLFVQCGCMQKTLEEWLVLCKDENTIQALQNPEQSIDLAMSLQWWRQYEQLISETVARLQAA